MLIVLVCIMYAACTFGYTELCIHVQCRLPSGSPCCVADCVLNRSCVVCIHVHVPNVHCTCTMYLMYIYMYIVLYVGIYMYIYLLHLSFNDHTYVHEVVLAALL